MAAEKRSNNLIIVLGLVTAVVGGGLVLLLLSRGGDSTVQSGSSGGNVPVLVSKRAIALGSAGADLGDAVEVKEVPAVTRSSGSRRRAHSRTLASSPAGNAPGAGYSGSAHATTSAQLRAGATCTTG